jgi:thiol:disulfide interchange protein
MHIPNTFIKALVAMSILVAAQPAMALPDIYPGTDQAHTDIADALQTAATSHRRIIVDFGGNWCPDCHVLDLYFHDATNKPLLEANYVLVHVNIGQEGKEDAILDIDKRYDIPVNKGVPALAVLDSDGKLLYSQKAGEFEAMRHMQSGAVTAFLTQWKPATAK